MTDARLPSGTAVVAALALSCARAGPPASPAPAPVAAAQPAARARPVVPPEIAFQLGLMPLASSGVAEFRLAHPTYDGRGVLIGILDSGVDPDALGLQATPGGSPKILDLRNLSGEGDVPLVPVTPDDAGRIALPGGLRADGAATVRAAATGPEWFGGVLEELPLGRMPAADLNGNGGNRDRFTVVVVRGASGWLAFVDADGDGTLADEAPVADFLVRRESFTFSSRLVPRGRGPIAAAVNIGDDPDRPGRPRLSFILDTSGHGTHVAGIAAGHDLFGLPGFDGLAPGAQLLGLKISDNSRGGVSTTGSMIAAMEYAARFAAERGLALVLNLSFGVGNEVEGAAAIDSLTDAFLIRHPDVVLTVSGGNDGPGTSTTGFPASAELAVAAGALYPGTFSRVQYGTEARDAMGWWGSRGGELAKPDLIVPALAFSCVPAWSTGDEIRLGTSMAAPYAAGLAALLASAELQQGRPVRAGRIVQALRSSARRLEGETQIDQGYGLPQAEAAYRWLAERHDAPRLRVQALSPATAVRPPAPLRGPDTAPLGRGPVRTAAYRRNGLAGPGDTVQLFRIAAVPESGAPPAGASFRLVSGAAWVRPAQPVVTLDGNGTALVELRYDPYLISRPGRHVGTVYGVSASDSASGPLFALANTVIVADSAPALSVGGRKLPAAGGAERFYLRVPEGASGLSVRAALRDSVAPATLSLYEPSGRPSRGSPRLDLGAGGPGRGAAALSFNDVVPGLWEMVMQAPPGREVRYEIQAVVPAVRIGPTDSVGQHPTLTFESRSARDTAVTVTAEQLGITRLREIVVTGGAAARESLEAPAWARYLVVETWVDADQWNMLTDVVVVVYDGAGEQLGQSAMDYRYQRMRVELPPHRATAYPLSVELFAAFAQRAAPARYAVGARFTFGGDGRRVHVSAGAPRDAAQPGAEAGFADAVTLRLPAGGASTVTLGDIVPVSSDPEWDEWVRVRASSRRDDWVAIERYLPVRLR